MMRLVQYLSQDRGRAIEFIEISLRPDFQKATQQVRAKWNIDPDRDFETDDERRAYQSILEFPDAQLCRDTENIVSDLGLSPSWNKLVHEHVVTGLMFAYNDKSTEITQNPNALVLVQNIEDPNDIILKIGPETVIDDFEPAWRLIKEIREAKSKPPRRRDRDSFRRDLTIFYLAQKGQSLVQISNAIDAEFGGEITFENIKKIVSTFCTRLKIPKKDRPRLIIRNYTQASL